VSFLQFAMIGVPFALLFLVPIWGTLWRLGRADAPTAEVGRSALATQSAQLGAMSAGEKVVLAVFATAAAVWITGAPITRALRERVWSGVATAHVEAGVAVLATLVLFAIRVAGRRALERASLRFVQWDTLLLVGGGFSLAACIQASGLSHWMGAQLGELRAAPAFAQVVAASVATVAISAVASNAATTAVMLPVLGGIAAPEHATPLLFAATFSASCDFALPAGTPPNAIVFGSGYLTIPMMARTGVVLDLVAALCAAAWCWIAVPLVLGAGVRP
jgi:sodium-dependent dicarboxylate transporter 2/3/5